MRENIECVLVACNLCIEILWNIHVVAAKKVEEDPSQRPSTNKICVVANSMMIVIFSLIVMILLVGGVGQRKFSP